IVHEHVNQRLLIALPSDGHRLFEGAPRLSKTKAIKARSQPIRGDPHRIHYTAHVRPSDVTSPDSYSPEHGTFHCHASTIFDNLVLADEINRAPAKVQSALLEAIAERQVSLGSRTYPLPSLFMVMATQNPIEQEGTHPLPEAQL